MVTTVLPDDNTVASFMEMMGMTDRAHAIEILQKCGNDIPNALAAMWDPEPVQSNKDVPELTVEAVNEALPFSDTPGISVQGPDVYGPAPYNSKYDGALSRPPSRATNNKSPLSRVIDLTADAALDMDDDMKQAIALSLEPQQSGIISTDNTGPKFGQATRDEYEPGKWDLVPTSAQNSNWETQIWPGSQATVSALEMMDPSSEDRKRDFQVPAFLRPSNSDHRLGALLTIFHGIPLIREIFLNRLNVAPQYGSNSEWWSGTPIELPTFPEEPDKLIKDEFLNEVQRLMAFLDKTERSYGSTEALERTQILQQRSPNCIETVFLERFCELNKNQQGVPQRFFSHAEVHNVSFPILELPLPSRDSLDETIYDMADTALWGDSSDLQLSEMPYLSHVSDVITFKFLRGADPKLEPVDIPPVWYPDRYLESNREAVFKMRERRQAAKDALKRSCAEEHKLTFKRCRVGNNMRDIKVKDLFALALRHDDRGILDEAAVDYDVFATLGSEGNSEMREAMDDAEPDPLLEQLSEELRILDKKIDAKLQALQDEKEKALQELRELSRLYTEPSTDPDSPKLSRYTLRGVSTSRRTMYICRQAEQDLIDMDLDDDKTSSRDQWWRINFASWGTSPIQVEKTTEAKVLEAARTETNTPLLVYANDRAMEPRDIALPAALEHFVQEDNALFRAELPQEAPSPTSPARLGADDLLSQSSDEPNQRWNPGKSGEDQEGDENHPIIIGVEPPDQEMQELSGRPLITTVTDANGSAPVDGLDMDLDNIVEQSKPRHVEFAD